MIRITTNGIIQNYKSSLMRANNNVNTARERVLTQRNFNSYAEDPAGATQAFKLRRAYLRTGDQVSNSTAVINKYSSAWSALDKISDSLSGEKGVISDALKATNDPTGSARQALAQSLKAEAEAIVQNLNTKYGDSFLFAGTDGLNVPFTWSEDKSTLYYRGIDINTKDPVELEKLKTMSNEAAYVDLGMGLQETEAGEFITSSGFNSAISGVGILGYGVDKDGDPKNAVSILMELSNVFSNCDADTGEFAAGDKERADALLTKLQSSMDEINSKRTQLDGQSNFLETNKTRLKENADTLNEQILSIEQVDLADAITEFSWAQYCFNSALKVGNNILSQSLIDYMN